MSSDTPQRKLRQGRLPFSPVDPKAKKRRKISTEDEGSKMSKILCSEGELSSSEKDVSVFLPLLKPKPSEVKVDEEVPVEEKENIQSQVVEPDSEDSESETQEGVLSEDPKNIDDSDDDIKVVLIKTEKHSDLVNVVNDEKEPVKKFKKSNGQKNPKTRKDVGTRCKRKRTNSFKKPLHINSIDKMFRNIEGKQDKPSEKNIVLSSESLKHRETQNDTKVMENNNDDDDDDDDDEDESSEDKNKSNETKKTDDELSETLTSKLKEKSSSMDEVCVGGTNESREKWVDSDKSYSSLNTSYSQSQEGSESSEIDSKEQTDEPLLTKFPKIPLSERKLLFSNKKRKLTPTQQMKQEEMKQRKEERIKLKLEKERLKKEKEEEKQKLKEEKQKKKLEEQEVKEKEKEEKRIKKEEERLKREEEKQRKEEERLRKEEEKQKKEEERLKKEEERLLAEKEEREKQKKRKANFARFFVPKKMEVSTLQKKESENVAGNFILFQVKDNMRIAPLVRSSLSNEEREILNCILNDGMNKSSSNYLKEIKREDYARGRSFKTFPAIEKPEDDCEILSEEEEDIDGTDILEENKFFQNKSKQRVKLLQFCENSRPAYYGTWSKMPVSISGRKPFAKEEVFDYNYDSDEDWEEVENGESLSDSDGEAEEGGEEEYEVDNDFFVPHGYLSEGEGEEEEEENENENEEEGDNKEKEKDENLQKEKLKQKQAEFELEMKQKTTKLKPKVFGCVWFQDRTSHSAYDQLLKILSLHRAVVMFGSCPVNIEAKEIQSQELKEMEDDEEESTKKFVKSFPEKAVPDLIRLIHGNRHSKLFLIREFSEHWKKKQSENAEEHLTGTPGNSSGGCIALRKIEPKIQELAQYGRFSEAGVSLKYRTWYVSKEVRKKYGLENLSARNSWTYNLTPKEWGKEESKEEKPEEANDQQQPQQTKGTNLITKFTKVLNGEDEKRKFNSPLQSSLGNNTSSPSGFKPLKPNKTSGSVISNASSPQLSGKKIKKKVSLITLPNEQGEIPKTSSSVATLFQNIDKKESGSKNLSSQKEQHEKSKLEFIILD